MITTTTAFLVLMALYMAYTIGYYDGAGGRPPSGPFGPHAPQLLQ